MGHDDGGGIVLKGALDHFAGVNGSLGNRAHEQHFIGNQVVPGVQEQDGEDLPFKLCQLDGQVLPDTVRAGVRHARLPDAVFQNAKGAPDGGILAFACAGRIHASHDLTSRLGGVVVRRSGGVGSTSGRRLFHALAFPFWRSRAFKFARLSGAAGGWLPREFPGPSLPPRSVRVLQWVPLPSGLPEFPEFPEFENAPFSQLGSPQTRIGMRLSRVSRVSRVGNEGVRINRTRSGHLGGGSLALQGGDVRPLAFLQLVQIVRPCLHHLPALRQVGGSVIGASVGVFHGMG